MLVATRRCGLNRLIGEKGVFRKGTPFAVLALVDGGGERWHGRLEELCFRRGSCLIWFTSQNHAERTAKMERTGGSPSSRLPQLPEQAKAEPQAPLTLPPKTPLTPRQNNRKSSIASTPFSVATRLLGHVRLTSRFGTGKAVTMGQQHPSLCQIAWTTRRLVVIPTTP